MTFGLRSAHIAEASWRLAASPNVIPGSIFKRCLMAMRTDAESSASNTVIGECDSSFANDRKWTEGHPR
jgi:hypothetical protein